MAVLQDYISWRGDLTWNERPFNDPDNLVFAELIYYHFEEILTESDVSVTLSDVWERHPNVIHTIPYGANDPMEFFTECITAERFRNVRIRDFRKITDTEQQIQFAAGTFELPDGSVYVAFRGTDDTIVGWREDFNFSFMRETPAQAEAVHYLTHVLDTCNGPVRVGGHSKGGNLAVYAAAFHKSDHGNRIVAVYSNDGPGFNRAVTCRDSYRQVLPKVKLIMPEESIVGIILSNTSRKMIVRSTASGAMQHHPLTWMVDKDSFITADKQASGSLLLDDIMAQWLSTMTDEQTQQFVNTLFDVIEASGAKTFSDMHKQPWICYNAILRASVNLTAEDRTHLLQAAQMLAKAGANVIWNETQKRFEPMLVKRT